MIKAAEKVTTKRALEMLQQRGIKVSYPTIAMWVREGKFPGAELMDNPRGAVWMIPTKSVESFQPPIKGRPKVNERER